MIKLAMKSKKRLKFAKDPYFCSALPNLKSLKKKISRNPKSKEGRKIGSPPMQNNTMMGNYLRILMTVKMMSKEIMKGRSTKIKMMKISMKIIHS